MTDDGDLQINKHILGKNLLNKVIDIHTHSGISLKSYAQTEFPYCQNIEALYYQQKLYNIDCSVVFPFSGELYFDTHTFITQNKLVPAKKPVSLVPYERENRMLLTEIFRFCPEYQNRFLPFVSVDPGREIRGQIKLLDKLIKDFPVYGFKISPVGCQSKVTALLKEGKPLLDFAKAHDLPILFHVTVHPEETFSQVSDTFKVIEKNSELRFCLAHCLGFHKKFLELADSLPNVWVDTAALKIQVQLAYENSPLVASKSDRVDCDYNDHKKVMSGLAEQFPQTIIWGTDSPYYSFICYRLQARSKSVNFNLKGNYEDEKNALDILPDRLKKQVSCLNSLSFLFSP